MISNMVLWFQWGYVVINYGEVAEDFFCDNGLLYTERTLIFFFNQSIIVTVYK